MHLQGRVTSKWQSMVMSVDILLCSEGDFSNNTSDICTIHTLNDNTPKITTSILYQSVLQWTLATGMCIKNFWCWTYEAYFRKRKVKKLKRSSK